MLTTLPTRIDSKTNRALVFKLLKMSRDDCFDYMGEHLAKETNNILANEEYANGRVLLRVCSAVEMDDIEHKRIDDLGSVIDYGDDDPNRDFQGSKMYFFDLNRSLEDGEAGRDFVDTVKDRYKRVVKIHNARAQNGLERTDDFHMPCFVIAVLPRSAERELGDKISAGRSSAYNNMRGGSSMCEETVFAPEVLTRCKVATCKDLYTEIRGLVVDNPYFYERILESGSPVLKHLVLDMLNELENDKVVAKIPEQAALNLDLLGSYKGDKESFMSCLRWYCELEYYGRGFTATAFLDLACTKYSKEMEAFNLSDEEMKELRQLAIDNDNSHKGESENKREDALDYTDRDDKYNDDDYGNW